MSGTASARGRRIPWRTLLSDYAIAWVVVALFVFLTLTTPGFLTQQIGRAHV